MSFGAPRRPILMTLDLEPATKVMAELVAHVTDDQLGEPTPCPDYTLGDLLDHVGGLSLAFTAAATKETAALAGQGPSADASRLGDDWRTRIPRDLAELANAWRDPNAWTGMTQAGGIDLPGEIAGLVALDEVVIHGWDVARASGQPFDPNPAVLEAVHGFVAQFSGPGQEDSRAGLFGPEVPVAADRPLLDRVIGMAGRDPDWAPVSR
jgi:uncharacterized protein (TIGR03086 family)